MSAAAQIRAAREAAGLSQAELAARAGTSQPAVSAYESGARRPAKLTVARLLAAAAPRPSIILARHRDTIIDLARRNKAHNVRVFGSIARGQDTPDSDIDLLVAFRRGASLLDQAGLVLDLEEALGRRVDVVSDRAVKPGSTILMDAVPI